MDLSEVGVGKTLPLIRWAESVIQAKSVDKILVVCPVSIIANWQNEIERWSNLSHCALVGPKARRLKLLNEKADVHLVNYEGLRVMFAELLAAQFKAIIADEAHRAKSHAGSYRSPTQAFLLRELAKSATYRKIATGTVITNNIEDLWSLCQIIDPRIFRTNFFGFRNRFMVNKNAGKPWMTWPDWQPKPGAVEGIHKLLEPYAIRFEKRDVLKFLPPVLFQRRNVELSDEQRKAYNDLKKHFVTELESTICECGHERDRHGAAGWDDECRGSGCNCLGFVPSGKTEPLAALQILGRVTKLLQICSGFVYHEEGKPYHFKSNAKLAELKAVLEEIGNQRVIIWTAFKEEVSMILSLVGAEQAMSLTGDTPQEIRQDIVSFFNNGVFRYLICHPACAGEGLTILAPYAVYFSRGWKLGERLQSLGRNDRPGMEKICDNVTIIDLVSPGTIDEEVMAALADKKNLLDTINPKSFKDMMR